MDRVDRLGAPMRRHIHEWDNGAWRTFAPEARLRGGQFSIAGVIGTGLLVANGSGRVTLTLEHDFPAVVGPFGSACPDPDGLRGS